MTEQELAFAKRLVDAYHHGVRQPEVTRQGLILLQKSPKCTPENWAIYQRMIEALDRVIYEKHIIMADLFLEFQENYKVKQINKDDPENH